MRVRTVDDLQSALDDDMIWRRREITTLVTLTKTQGEIDQRVLLRASVPLLYAHWEGFGKNCGVRYLEFVSYRGVRFSELQPSFLYLDSMPVLKSVSDSPPSSAIGLLWQIYSNRDKKNRNSFRKRISTSSNLRFEILLEILALCGIAAQSFAEYENFINRELCGPRNEIAHGVGTSPTLEVFLKRRDKTFELMTLLQNSFVNAAANKQFLRSELR